MFKLLKKYTDFDGVPSRYDCSFVLSDGKTQYGTFSFDEIVDIIQKFPSEKRNCKIVNGIPYLKKGNLPVKQALFLGDSIAKTPGNIKYFSELQKRENELKKQWGFENVRLFGLDSDVVDAFFIQLARIYKDFPILKGFVEGFISSPPDESDPFGMKCDVLVCDETAKITGVQLIINFEEFKDLELAKRVQKFQLERGYKVKGSKFEHVITHELGHALMAYLIFNVLYENSVESADKRFYAASKIIENYRDKSKDKKSQLQELSEYALIDDYEAVAEMFVDYYANGIRAKRLSVAVVNYFKRKLNN